MTHPSTTLFLAALALVATLAAIRFGGELAERRRIAHHLPRPRKPRGSR